MTQHSFLLALPFIVSGFLATSCRHTGAASDVKSLRDVSERPLIDRTAIDVSTGEPVILVLDTSSQKPEADARLFIGSVLITLEEMESEDVCLRNLNKVEARTDKGMVPFLVIDHGEGESTFIYGYKLNLVPLPVTELHFTFDAAAGGPGQCRITVTGDGHWESAKDIGYVYQSENPARDQAIKAFGSSHEHRLQHYLWHTTRGLWNNLLTERDTLRAELSKKEPGTAPSDRLLTLEKSIQEFENAGWAPLRYFRREEKDTALSGAGEDFMYMHHQMLAAIKEHLATKGLPMVPSWKTLPLPGDKEFPLGPVGIKDEDLSEFKTDTYFYERQSLWEVAYKSPVVDVEALTDQLLKAKLAAKAKLGSADPEKAKPYSREEAKAEVILLLEPRPGLNFKGLKGISLSEYGHVLEMTIHNNLHSRYAVEGSSRPANTDPLDHATWMADWAQVYDTPSYDWLGDTYSSHVNPWFYRIHGWIEDRIMSWLDANDYKSIGTQESCLKEAKPCYVWLSDSRYVDKGNDLPWEGPTPVFAEQDEPKGMSLHAHKAPAFSPDVIQATRGLRAQNATMSRILLNPKLKK